MMKHRIFSILLAALALSGCTTLERLDTVKSQAEKLIQPGLESAAMATVETLPGILSRKEVRDIALKEAGLTLGQVSRLRIQYDPEDGQPRYEVEFHQGPWEYHYEIDAQTGAVLEQEREQ